MFVVCILTPCWIHVCSFLYQHLVFFSFVSSVFMFPAVFAWKPQSAGAQQQWRHVVWWTVYSLWFGLCDVRLATNRPFKWGSDSPCSTCLLFYRRNHNSKLKVSEESILEPQTFTVKTRRISLELTEPPTEKMTSNRHCQEPVSEMITLTLSPLISSLFREFQTKQLELLSSRKPDFI